ncbi:MAG: hypothetical protein JKY93_12435 [Gammaproteobacteria bacterium]|nr:hypothetical protein [Gammaproteobacteria bacterium]
MEYKDIKAAIKWLKWFEDDFYFGYTGANEHGETIKECLQANLDGTDIRSNKNYFWRWIERAHFSESLSAEGCVKTLVNSPYAPWNEDRESWDTKHLSYDAEIDKAIAEGKNAKETRDALTRQCDNMAFVLNRVDLHCWSERFATELAEDREILKGSKSTPLEIPNNWQSIETAPKDKTTFVCRDKYKPHVQFEATLFLEQESWEIPEEYLVLLNMTTDEPICENFEDYEWKLIDKAPQRSEPEPEPRCTQTEDMFS